MAIKLTKRAEHYEAVKGNQRLPLWVCGWSVLLANISFYLSGYFIIKEFLHVLANL